MIVIKLRLYRGKELSYDKHGQVKNENQLISLMSGGEWLNYLKYIQAQQLCKVELISVKDGDKGVDSKLFAKQLAEACGKNLEYELFPEKTAEKIIEEQLVPKMDNPSLRDDLKAKAAELGITYPKTISTPKLEELINKG